MRNFVSPHVHIKSLDSIGNIPDFAAREKELDTGYLVVTDHGTLEACRSVYDCCHKDNAGKLKPILGSEIYMRDDSCGVLQANGILQGINNPKRKAGEAEIKGYKDYIKYIHVTLHAQDETGFFELTKALSKADLRAEKHGSERKPLFDWDTIEHLGQYNITGTSGCLVGAVGRHLVKNNDMASAVGYYEKMRSLFKPGNFFVEIMPHACEDNWVKNVTFEIQGLPNLVVPVWKKIKTEAGEFQAEDLAKAYDSDPKSFLKKHKRIVGVMQNRKWVPQELTVVSVSAFEGFVHNECTDWSPDGALQVGLNNVLMGMAEKYGDTVLISDDSHFPTKDLKVAQDVRLGQDGAWKFSESHHRYSSNEAFEFFKARHGFSEKRFEKLVDNGYEWASKFDKFKFSERQTLPVDFYPKDTLKYTLDLIYAKKRAKMDDPVYVKRLAKELNMLHRNGKVDLLPYFATAEEGVREANLHGVWTGAGRGSSSGMLLAYYLGITHLDPIKWGLSEDRFLTQDRVLSGKMPDIDQDFEDTEVITGENGWLARRFGDCAAQISTDVTMHLSTAIQDVWRAKHGEVTDAIVEFCKRMPRPPQGVNDADFVFGYDTPEGDTILGVLDTNAELFDFTKKYPEEWDIVTKLLSVTRQRSRHPCARVIANEPISNFIPMATIGDVRVTAFTAAAVEAMGALKMDYLGLKTLGYLHGAVKLIQDRKAPHIDWSPSRSYHKELPFVTNNAGKPIEMLYAVPFQGDLFSIWDLPKHPEVVASAVEGDTKGVFQLDTPSAVKWLKVFNFDKPDGSGKGLSTVEDLANFVALDRPGPLDAYVAAQDGTKHNMLVEYARRVKGQQPCGDIPELSKLLPETYGVITYQEQLSRVYQYFTGCTGAEAEEFRGYAAKKKPKEMQKAHALFMERAETKMSAEVAQQIWDRLVTFANYGFCIDGEQGIMTKTGPVLMKDVTTEHEVATWTGEEIIFERPVAAWNSGNKEVIKVELDDGTSIMATADHKFLYTGNWFTLSESIEWGLMESPDTATLLSVESSASLGVRPVYDLEMPTHHNFVLNNGTVAHNCKAHAAAYATISYACAWIKYHYPLEWWTSVLNTCDKDDLETKYWAEVSETLLLPDITKQNHDFAIEGDKIRAPISMLNGIGDKQFEQLIQMGPYVDIYDLMAKIEKYKVDNAFEIVTEKRAGESVTVRRKGRSPLGPSMVAKLILAGVCDGLFPKTDEFGLPLTTEGKLVELAKAEAKAAGKKKLNNYATKFTFNDALQSYQNRKGILPAYQNDLKALVLKEYGNQLISQGNLKYVHAKNKQYILLDGTAIEAMENLNLVPRGGMTYAGAAYVIKHETKTHQDKKTKIQKKKALLTLDFDGYRTEQLIWPDDDGNLPPEFENDLKGAIVLVCLYKHTNLRVYFNGIQVVSHPINRKVNTDETE